MDQVREVLRYYHYAYRTEQTYCDWIKRYLKFHGMKRHPQEMGAPEVERYLSDLATKGKLPLPWSLLFLNRLAPRPPHPHPVCRKGFIYFAVAGRRAISFSAAVRIRASCLSSGRDRSISVFSFPFQMRFPVFAS